MDYSSIADSTVIMMKKNEKTALLFFFGLSFVVLAALFYFSGQDGEHSQGLSKSLAAGVLQIIKKDYTAEDLKVCNYILRRLAHFTLFMLLGVGITGGLYVRHQRWAFPIALSIGLVVAVLNEVQQVFSINRSPKIGDVRLDAVGVLAGCGLYYLVAHLVYCYRLRRDRNDSD